MRLQDGVVAGEQFLAGHVGAETHAAEEPHLGIFENPLKIHGDRLDRLVVGCDSIPHQAVQGGQPVEHIHLYDPPAPELRSLLDQQNPKRETKEFPFDFDCSEPTRGGAPCR